MADFLLRWWPILATAGAVIFGQVIQTKIVSIKLDNLCEQVKKQNSRVGKLEDARINHIKEFHSQH